MCVIKASGVAGESEHGTAVHSRFTRLTKWSGGVATGRTGQQIDYDDEMVIIVLRATNKAVRNSGPGRSPVRNGLSG